MKYLAIIGLVVVGLLLTACQAPQETVPFQSPALTNSVSITASQSPALTTSLTASTQSGLPFKASMNLDGERFLPGVAIIYGMSITNLSSGVITINPFPPATQIKSLDQDKVVYSEPAGTRTRDIKTEGPDSWYHTLPQWFQQDDSGNQVAPGWYELSCDYVIIEQATSKSYTAHLTARCQIVSPVSAMNKNLDVNRSVTVEGTTATLERIEFNSVRTTVYILTVPPGYTLIPGKPPESTAQVLSKSTIEYSVDGGILQQPVSNRSEYNDKGARLIWELGSVPSSAKEFILRITRLGDQIGIWEFKISLF
jgi:hypothetical protein